MTEKELNAYEMGRKAGRDEAVEILKANKKEFVPADQVWFGDSEHKNGQWKLVPKDSGMYCLNCERFRPEEGCLCRMVDIDDTIKALQDK